MKETKILNKIKYNIEIAANQLCPSDVLPNKTHLISPGTFTQHTHTHIHTLISSIHLMKTAQEGSMAMVHKLNDNKRNF